MKLHGDWVEDGSWTVDCVCGVSFDDGKEMVNCDECGVWVHTRCSRYVKGDDSFACHKCKNKNYENEDKEEEEEVVAPNLLVNKALRVEIPIEERVHVQGVPGGDLALLESFSSVFSRQLWKCSGYVPKKLRFQYREFPCWDDKENACEIRHQDKEEEEEEEEDTCDGGALLSMSKAKDVAASIGTTKGLDGKGTDPKKIIIKWDSREIEMKQSQSDVNKEKSLLFPLTRNKGRKESLGAYEDQVKKKVKVAEKE